MHYHWQVLTTASNENEAKEKATKILNNINEQTNIYDYYDIGGRWKERENIVNAKEHSKLFWGRIEQALNSQANQLSEFQDSLKQYLEKEVLNLQELIFSPKLETGNFKNSMSLHCLYKIATIKSGYYCSDSYFATEGEIWGSPELPENVKKEIEKNPENYWLVSFDLHN